MSWVVLDLIYAVAQGSHHKVSLGLQTESFSSVYFLQLMDFPLSRVRPRGVGMAQLVYVRKMSPSSSY